MAVAIPLFQLLAQRCDLLLNTLEPLNTLGFGILPLELCQLHFAQGAQRALLELLDISYCLRTSATALGHIGAQHPALPIPIPLVFITWGWRNVIDQQSLLMGTHLRLCRFEA